jgi:hypothetical protein
MNRGRLGEWDRSTDVKRTGLGSGKGDRNGFVKGWWECHRGPPRTYEGLGSGIGDRDGFVKACGSAIRDHQKLMMAWEVASKDLEACGPLCHGIGNHIRLLEGELVCVTQ